MLPYILLNEVKKNNVVLFLGAGLSSSNNVGGIPSAFEFAKTINKRFFNNKKCVKSSSDLSYISQEAIWEQNGSRSALNALINDTFNNAKSRPLNAHQLLARIGFPMITTNYDTLIEKAFANEGKKLIKVVHDKQIPIATEPYLIKIHGCAEEPDTCIITEKDYYNYIYSDCELKKFIRTIFIKSQIIFIGYSISDINFRLLLLDLKTRLGVNISNKYFLAYKPDDTSYDYNFLCKELNIIPIVGNLEDFLFEIYNANVSSMVYHYYDYYKLNYLASDEIYTKSLAEFAASRIADGLENNAAPPLILDKNILPIINKRLSGHTYSIEIKNDMLFVPKGSFIMGGSRSGNETIRIENIPYDYYIDEVPVTNKKYREFLKSHDCLSHKYCHKNEPANKNHEPFADYDVTKIHHYKEGQWLTDDYFTNDMYDDYPVVLIDWWDAYAYAQWAGKSLPTEQEWEKAARGIDGRLFPYGNEFDSDCCNVLETKINTLTPTHKYKNGISPYGCFDMCGNIWEWCNDDFTPNSPFSSKLLKGGSRTRNYIKALPSIRNCREASERWISRGFRCVIRKNEENGYER